MKKTNFMLVIGVLLFCTITFLVTNGYTLELDNAVYNFVSSFQNDVLTDFFRVVTEFGDIPVVTIIVIIFLLILRNSIGLFPLIVAIDVELLNLLLKFIIKRERPGVLHLVEVSNYSYPSGHAMMSMGVYGCLIYLIWKYVDDKKLKTIAITLLCLLILLIGISRIYLGVHYFTDIIAGFIVSFCYLIIFDKVVKKWGKVK